jgi:AbiV family abortive infection protein
MRSRQFHQLANRNEGEFFSLLAEGLSVIAEHGWNLNVSAGSLSDKKEFRGARVLHTLAEEEAGKFLVLLDAARLGRHNQQNLASHLRRAGDHLAKGLYAKSADIRPSDFKELLGYLQHERNSQYLDGPNDVDWIFRNAVLSSREEVFYVDLVSTEDSLLWLSPQRFDIVGTGDTPSAVALMHSLANLGSCQPKALSIITDTWQDFAPTPDTHWQEVKERISHMIDQIDSAGLVGPDFTDNDHRRILDSWAFPLHGIELTKIDVDTQVLKARQTAALERLHDDHFGRPLSR